MATKELDPGAMELSRQLKHVPAGEQYDRMISGMLYDPADPALEASRFRVRKLCNKYNRDFPDDLNTFAELAEFRGNLLSQFLGAIGDNREIDAFIEPPFNVDYGCNIRLGKRFYANFNLTILDCALVDIGDRVMMGPNVAIYTATHEVEVQSRIDNIEYCRPVTIGNDCWIGGNVVILPGVTIGNGCTIASGAVVTKSVPEYSVAMGVPAKVVKKVAKVEGGSSKP